MSRVRLIAGRRGADDVDLVFEVNSKTASSFCDIAGKIGRVGQSAARRIQLAHECVRVRIASSALKGRSADREVAGRGCPRHHHVECRVDCDSSTGIRAISSQVGGEHDGVARGVQFGHENIRRSSEQGLKRRRWRIGRGLWCERKVSRGGRSREVNIRGCVDRNRRASRRWSRSSHDHGAGFVTAAAKVCRVGENGVNYQNAGAIIGRYLKAHPAIVS